MKTDLRLVTSESFTCPSCNQEKKHHSKGLCRTCYDAQRRETPSNVDFDYIPDCPVYSDVELEAEWYARQQAADKKRRPVDPPKAPSQRSRQIEMFHSTHEKIFTSDMKFKKFEFVPGKDKEDGITAKIVLEVDAISATFFEPLLHLSDQYVDVLLAGTKQTVKDLGK